MLAHELKIEIGNDFIDALREIHSIVDFSVAFGEFIGLMIVAERLLVLPEVVVVLAQRMTQADLVSERQWRGQQSLHTPQPEM